MKGKYLTMDDAFKIENFEKLKAENTMLKTNNLALEGIIKCKNKDIEKLKNFIKEQNDKIEELKSLNVEQMDIFGGKK